MTLLVRDIMNLIRNFKYVYRKLENLLVDQISRFIFWGEFSLITHEQKRPEEEMMCRVDSPKANAGF